MRLPETCKILHGGSRGRFRVVAQTMARAVVDVALCYEGRYCLCFERMMCKNSCGIRKLIGKKNSERTRGAPRSVVQEFW